MEHKTNILPILSGILTSLIFGLSFLFSKKALNISGSFYFTIISLSCCLYNYDYTYLIWNYKNKF